MTEESKSDAGHIVASASDHEGKDTTEESKVLQVVKRLPWYQRQLLALCLGQLLSLCLTSCGVTSQSLATFYLVDIPTTQSFLNYFLLGLVYSLISLRNHKRFFKSIRQRWWILLLLAFVDVEANFVIVTAYQYTTITSVMLLDCFTIPCVMILSFIILKERFRWLHIVSVIICIGGLIILLYSDAIRDQDSEGSQQILGDMLVLLSSILYSISNVGQQYQVERHSNSEFLAMLGVFGSIISFIQMMVLELDELKSIDWSWQIVMLVIAFGLSLFVLYSVTPFLLQISSATLMNISFLTADAYSLIAGIVIFNYVLSPLYFISLFVTIVGLTLYNILPSSKALTEEITETKMSPDQDSEISG